MGALSRVAIALLLTPAAASAQDRRCAGDDPASADRARSRVASILQANMGRSRVRVAALREAVEEAGRLCAAGDPLGLFHRAVAFDALAEFVSAALDLDAFLELRPERAGDPFVRSLRERVDARVGRITFLTGRVPGAQLTVGAQTLAPGARTLAVSPGELRVGAELDGHPRASTTVRVAAGERVVVTLRSDSDAPQPGPELVLRRVAPSLPPPPAPPRITHPLRPWAIAASAATGATLALGLGMLVWRSSSASTYSGLGCESMNPASAACIDTYAQFRDANAATIGTLVTAGALAIGAGVLWLLDLRAPSSRAGACAPMIPGAVCVLRF